MTDPIAIPALVAWLAGRGVWGADSKPEGGAGALRSVSEATFRESEAFLRFFSARYAPLGAANDPTGLNRFHAANLIAQYRRVGGERDRG